MPSPNVAEWYWAPLTAVLPEVGAREPVRLPTLAALCIVQKFNRHAPFKGVADG